MECVEISANMRKATILAVRFYDKIEWVVYIKFNCKRGSIKSLMVSK